MSSVPPNMPPGGIPPYDPKTQWRVYREQQRAAWKAQRDAWKAQRDAAKASYIGAYGPRVPSVVGPVLLIAIGIVALLVIAGRIGAGDFWAWYGHWWPLLLIVAGLALLGEAAALSESSSCWQSWASSPPDGIMRSRGFNSGTITITMDSTTTSSMSSACPSTTANNRCCLRRFRPTPPSIFRIPAET